MKKLITLLLITLLSQTTLARVSKQSRRHNLVRIDHVKELLGNRVRRSIASVTHDEVREGILNFAMKTLPKSHRKHAQSITNTIIEQSLKYEMDPMFLAAIIYNESSFNPSASGTSGEIGLMQILPSTGKWLAKKFKMKWNGKETLKDPKANIRLGAAYVNHLREKYKHGQLYLAAYNMGPGNLRKALRANIRPVDYTVAVMKRYFELYKTI